MPRKVVAEDSVLDLVKKHIIIPEKVYQEVVIQGMGKAGSKEVEEARQRGWLMVQPVLDQKTVVALTDERIQLAEVESIILAYEKGADFLIMDDVVAREEAERYLAGLCGLWQDERNPEEIY